jgi:hypothetical protein
MSPMDKISRKKKINCSSVNATSGKGTDKNITNWKLRDNNPLALTKIHGVLTASNLHKNCNPISLTPS